MGTNLREHLLPAEIAALDLSPEYLSSTMEFHVLSRGHGWAKGMVRGYWWGNELVTRLYQQGMPVPEWVK